MSFYVTLPSDASMNIFENNSQSEFTTLLNSPIICDSSYEVALVEISHSQDYAVDGGTIIITIPGSDKKIEKNISFHEYDSINSIVDWTNQCIIIAICAELGINPYAKEELGKRIKLEAKEFVENKNAILAAHFKKHHLIASGTWNETISLAAFPRFDVDVFRPNQFIVMTIPPAFTIEIQGRLRGVLNLEDRIYDSSQHIRIRNAKVHFIDTFFVYSDILEPQIVGDTVAQLLRTVPTSSYNTGYTSVNFESPHYIKLCSTRISTINIKILDSLGHKIQFQNHLTRVLVKLHFRKHGL